MEISRLITLKGWFEEKLKKKKKSKLIGQLTTLIVPMRTLGGTASAETISEIKLAVIPMIAMRETTCIPLVTMKVAPSAPLSFIVMLDF
jgi:hypothetical protein